MKYLSIVIFLVLFPVVHAENQNAITDTGKAVILKDDGTWNYASGILSSKKIAIKNNYKKFKKPVDSTFQVKSTRNDSSVWINHKKWTFKKSTTNPAAEYLFRAKDKDLYVMLIAEGIGMTTEGLADIAFANAKRVAVNAKILKKEYRNVNGKKVIYMEISGILKGINFIYRGYYYSDKKGSTQLVAYTSANLVDKYKDNIEGILNGLVFR